MIQIDLAPLSREDLPQLLTWRNDWRIMAWTRQSDFLNEVNHAAWYERQAKDPATSMYKIMFKMGGTTTVAGVCGFTSIDLHSRRAEFSCYVAPALHGKGIGSNSLKLLFSHGFDNLGLNVIWGETFDGNPAAKRFEALGMTKEGTRRQFYWKNGKFIDAHLYSLTAEDFYGRQLAASGSATDPIPSAGGDRGAGHIDPIPLKTRRARKAKSGQPVSLPELQTPGTP